MEEPLVAFLSGETDPRKVLISYHVGGGRGGETELSLDGSGGYHLWSTVTRDRRRRDYSGEVRAAEVQELIREILRVRLWEVDHVARERGLDNPEARINVRVGPDAFSAALWVSEIDDVRSFDEVQEQILGVVRRVSDGEVLEVGR